jgi:hypothetical protein
MKFPAFSSHDKNPAGNCSIVDSSGPAFALTVNQGYHGDVCLQTFSDHSSAIDVNNGMIPIDFSTPEYRVTTKNKARIA